MLKRIPLFYKYLLSYSILLIIPLIVTSLFSYKHYVSILKEEIMLGHEQMLEQMRDTFDTKIREMNTISYEISSNPELTPYYLEQNMYHAYAAKRLLNFTVANNFFQNVFLYIKEGDYIYSAESTYSIPLFTDKIYQYRNWSPSQFRNDLNRLETPVFRPAEEVDSSLLKSNRAITYIVPLPPSGVEPYGAAIFIIDEDTVKGLQRGGIEERVGNTLILNEKGEVITSLYDTDYLQDQSFLQSIKALSPGSKSIKIKKEQYILSTAKSKYTGWTYLTMMPQEHLLKKVGQVQYRAMIVLIANLFMGSIVIYFLMRINYSPLQKIFSYTTLQLGKSVQNSNDVLNMLSNMSKKSKDIENKWKDNQYAIRKYLLIELLHGQITDMKEFYDRGEEVGLNFRKKRMFVLRCEIKDEDIDNKAIISERINNEIYTRYEGYEVKWANQNVITYICTLGKEDQQLKEFILFLHKILKEQCQGSITIGVGCIYEDMNKIGKSYMEASTALDYKLIKGQNQVIFFDEINSENQLDYWYPKQEIETLQLLVNERDTAKIIEMIKNIHRDVEKNKPPLHMVRCICYDIINCIIKNSYNKENSYLEDITYLDIEKLSNFETLQDFEQLANEICMRLQEVVQEQNVESDLRERAIAFIRENYRDNQFSVQKMADSLSVAQTYLKRYFKQQTGQTITDYLSFYRIEHAKQLLKNSNISLKELVKEIGYHDVSSFIRKFKNEMKITPGEYRKINIDRKKVN
ncbi:helix-turn-helix domain-containing protein [Bacillus sp. FSL K6-3431]|uniref:helix-turn-helix domain-containing protein n=1 Tax=Bacillus sp. FSL K6-3431 TaxID=2921500 RepID=UPI0030FB2EF6